MAGLVASPPVRHAGLRLFLIECGWRGSAGVLEMIIQWMSDQDITSRQDLDGFRYEDFAQAERMPPEVAMFECMPHVRWSYCPFGFAAVVEFPGGCAQGGEQAQTQVFSTSGGAFSASAGGPTT